MLQPGDPMAAQLGFYGAVVFATFKALVAIGLFGMVAIGFLFARMTLAERVLAFAASLCLLGEFQFSDTTGFRITIAIVLWQWRQRPRAGGAARAAMLAPAGIVKTLAVAVFTLVWTHSIEKVDWQEDGVLPPHGLELVRRVKAPAAWSHRPTRGWSAAGFNGSRNVAAMPEWRSAIQAPPANGGCARMAGVGRCRRYLDFNLAPTSRQ